MAKKAFGAVGGRISRHFHQDIWIKDIGDMGTWRQRAVAFSRLAYMVSTGFVADHCIIRASALTFITILSIVPLLAVAFSISKGFGLQNADFFRDFLMGVSAGRTEVVDRILQYIGNTNVKTLGWIGVGALLVTVFTTVGNVERAFNTIWAVKRGRSSWRKFTDFFSIIVICPVVVLVAASVSVAVQKMDLVHQFVSDPGYDSLEKFILKLISLILVWVGFTFAYAFIPNTKVRLSAAVTGGFVAGSLWLSAQWVYIHWQIGFTKYNAIYGSFAQLPLFLVWLYISWILVLLGAEISFAVQHLGSAVRRGLVESLNPLARQKVAVLALGQVAARFMDGLRPLTVRELSRVLRLPEDAVMEALTLLAATGMTVALKEDEEEPAFTLAIAPENIHLADVAEAVLVCGENQGCGELFAQTERVDAVLATFTEAVRASAANVTLAEFAQGMRAGALRDARKAAAATAMGMGGEGAATS